MKALDLWGVSQGAGRGGAPLRKAVRNLPGNAGSDNEDLEEKGPEAEGKACSEGRGLDLPEDVPPGRHSSAGPWPSRARRSQHSRSLTDCPAVPHFVYFPLESPRPCPHSFKT